MAVAENLAQPIGLEQTRGGTEDVADRDRAAEHGGGVLAHRVVGQGQHQGRRTRRAVEASDSARSRRWRAASRPGSGISRQRHGQADCRTCTPSAIRGALPQAVVLPAEREDRPSESNRAGSGRGVRSMSASGPRAPGDGGGGELAVESGGFGGHVDPGRVARRVDEIEHAQYEARSPGSPGLVPQRSLLATDPCAIVASGPKKAAPIARVLRPPTARRVNATCEAGARSGWQQQKSRKSVSSPSTDWPRPAAARCIVISRRWRAASLRRASTIRRDATARATRAGRAAGARATPAAPPAELLAPRPQRHRSPRPAGPGPRAPQGRGRAARRRPAVASARRSRRISPPTARPT